MIRQLSLFVIRGTDKDGKCIQTGSASPEIDSETDSNHGEQTRTALNFREGQSALAQGQRPKEGRRASTEKG